MNHFSSRVCVPPSWRRSRAEHISGVTDNETIPEAKIEMMMVMANSWKTRPITPGMNASGRKTVASERVIERMVKLISLALLKVASTAFSPASIRRTVFSRKTMASSTRNPIASVNAISERLSRL